MGEVERLLVYPTIDWAFAQKIRVKVNCWQAKGQVKVGQKSKASNAMIWAQS